MSLRGQQEQPEATEDLWQCLVTVREGTHYAMSAEIVRGLGSLPPGVPQSDLLAHFPGAPAVGVPGRVVLCGHRQVQQAVLVDEILGLTQVAKAEIRPLPAQFVGPERLWFSGLFLFQATIALIVNPEWLLVQSAQPVLIGSGMAEDQEQDGSTSGLDVTAQKRVEDDLDGLVLEEASDVEDTPWAEL